MNIVNTIRQLINRCGLDLRVIGRGAHRQRTRIEESYALVRELGFQPKTVIDVGVASGTPELYDAFPDAYFLLVEPLQEFEPALMSILHRCTGSFVLAAAGSKQGQVTFNVHAEHLEGSSLHKESMGAEVDGKEIKVEMVRIDDIIEEKNLDGPHLIKVDVQGGEIDALEGAQKTLLSTEVVVLEVSLFEFMKDAPQLHDVVLYMKNLGFVTYDIIHGWNRPLDNALGQVDIVFVKERGFFRQDHSYSTIDHMKKNINN